ncbi:MAG: transglutaminase domain-containing protein [Candidatus Helarchaeota archaeon]
MNKWIKWIIKSAKFYKKYPNVVNEILNKNADIKDYIESDEKLIIKQLEKKLKTYQPSEKEIYYNNKYPKVHINYIRHETDGDYYIDVRNFFQMYDFSLPLISGNTDDEKALKCLLWVQNNIQYTPDKSEYGYPEYWAYSYQTLKRRAGDCDDGGILLANMMLHSGIPYWKVRLSAADVYDKGGNYLGGHCYVTYYCESKDKWVAMDWCFYPNQLPVEDRPDYKNEIIYGKGKVWFSWNLKYAFSKSTATEIKNIHIKNKKKL